MSNFDSYQYQWMDPFGPLSTLHKINPVRLSFVKKVLKKKTKEVLDVGCGGGIFTFYLHSALPELSITGIDSSPKAIQAAQAYANSNHLKLNFHKQSATQLTQKKYNLIICYELIEHVEDPKTLLKALSQQLTKNGLLIISTLDKTTFSFLQNILIAEHLLEIVPKGTHAYNQFISPDALIEMAQIYKLRPILINGIHIDPLSYQFSLSESTQPNYFIAFELST